jgi:uncharacterized paraquat-inducible protein A
MNKFLEITKSWIAALNPSEEQQQRADQRIAVCNECPFRKYNDVGDFYYCGKCGCPLKSKVYSPVEKSCPENKWPV